MVYAHYGYSMATGHEIELALLVIDCQHYCSYAALFGNKAHMSLLLSPASPYKSIRLFLNLGSMLFQKKALSTDKPYVVFLWERKVTKMFFKLI